MKPPSEETVTQIAMIVEDIDKACDQYARTFGIDKPEWFLTEPPEQSRINYRGATTPARAKLAFVRFANLTFELIEPVDGPSVWRDFLDQHGEGVHHIAFNVQGMTQAVESFSERGIPLAQTGEYTGGRYAYLDGKAALGVDIELLEND
ncbi:VOC family protein [Candidatus Latescibacterota bacterium]